VAKEKSEFQCIECGHVSVKWLGKCPDCQTWNSFVEETKFSGKSSSGPANYPRQRERNSQPRPINQIVETEVDRVNSGIGEFDRVMGGGITTGSLTLIGGEPGIGKSTLLMEVLGKLAAIYTDEKILYVSGEESEQQIASRARRLGINAPNFYIYHETLWESIKEKYQDLKPKFLVLDSIQTTLSAQISSAGGTISQIREITFEVMNLCKTHGVTGFLIGHVTKEGSISGPKMLEHMVDTVIYFEGDQHYFYRLLRSIKNRFGNTQEVGIFEMQESGLKEVINPSFYFLQQENEGAFGRAITCLLEGTRPLLVEVQALVTENKYGTGRRTTQGVDTNRVAMLVAVIEKYFELPFAYCDIYVNIVGGIKLEGRDTDLAIIAALLSSYYKVAIEPKTIFLGEVGLTGEVRSVPLVETRLNEVEKLGYNQAVLAQGKSSQKDRKKMNLKILNRVVDMKKYFT